MGSKTISERFKGSSSFLFTCSGDRLRARLKCRPTLTLGVSMERSVNCCASVFLFSMCDRSV